jgi:hypothetical protein
LAVRREAAREAITGVSALATHEAQADPREFGGEPYQLGACTNAASSPRYRAANAAREVPQATHPQRKEAKVKVLKVSFTSKREMTYNTGPWIAVEVGDDE